jgi:hypothetical protein
MIGTSIYVEQCPASYCEYDWMFHKPLSDTNASTATALISCYIPQPYIVIQSFLKFEDLCEASHQFGQITLRRRQPLKKNPSSLIMEPRQFGKEEEGHRFQMPEKVLLHQDFPLGDTRGRLSTNNLSASEQVKLLKSIRDELTSQSTTILYVWNTVLQMLYLTIAFLFGLYALWGYHKQVESNDLALISICLSSDSVRLPPKKSDSSLFILIKSEFYSESML